MSEEKFVVSFDIDDVITHYDEREFLKFGREQYNWHIDLEAFARTHDWSKATGGKVTEEISPVFSEFMLRNAHLQRIIPGAQKTLRELSTCCDLHAITARTRALREITMQIFNEGDIHTVFSSITWGARKKKGPVIAEKQVKIHVEDDAKEIESIIVNGAGVLVIQFPSFRGGKQPIIDDSRVHRLRACNHVQCSETKADKELIWKSAWAEIEDVVQRASIFQLT